MSKDRSAKARLSSLVNHGFTSKFHFVHTEPAINAKINGLGAALACGVLDRLEDIVQHRSRLAGWYRKRLQLLVDANHLSALMPECGVGDTPWVFGVVCKSRQQRTEIRIHLARHGIETRDYFFPCHLQPIFKEQRCNSKKLYVKYN